MQPSSWRMTTSSRRAAGYSCLREFSRRFPCSARAPDVLLLNLTFSSTIVATMVSGWHHCHCVPHFGCPKASSHHHACDMVGVAQAFDGQLRASVSASLNGDLPHECWWQVTTGVTCGGLGLGTALEISPTAFVSRRIMCRPLLTTMVDHVDHHGRSRQPCLRREHQCSPCALCLDASA